MSDYISIQKAIEKINERARETFTFASGYEYYLGALHDVADDLRQMPTIDVEPVKHGVWEKVKYEDDDGYYYLYVHKDCGCEQAGERNYCPYCGAKMDGVEDDVVD